MLFTSEKNAAVSSVDDFDQESYRRRPDLCSRSVPCMPALTRGWLKSYSQNFLNRL